ncbi:hypothetical protein CSOJ01_09938 [Colletotrichum sojae]|uniref:Uncharacterized protein n=1 Tax=Colletotrichum sojae TaxID=2175907 RepID=A0A8H6MQU1_9PEZI|nr:hypothetical protein CSOJ01_09938 [Colletotrichum sojae]
MNQETSSLLRNDICSTNQRHPTPPPPPLQRSPQQNVRSPELPSGAGLVGVPSPRRPQLVQNWQLSPPLPPEDAFPLRGVLLL